MNVGQLLQRNAVRRLALVLAVFACALLCVEIVARYIIGFGDPPLFVAHASIEYHLAPRQVRRRFGNTISVNSHGMRAPEFPSKKIDSRSLRVLVFGDSIVYAGAHIDGTELATALAAEELGSVRNRPVVVGNVAAPSWGPANCAAYGAEYGFFEADIVLLVLSSHDIADRPVFGPLDSFTHPTTSPRFAASELVRHLVRRLASEGDDSASHAEPDRPTESAAIRDFVTRARAEGASVGIIRHWSRSEATDSGPVPAGLLEIERAAEAAGAHVADDRDTLLAGLSSPHLPYADDIHLNASGQRRLAQTIRECVVFLLDRQHSARRASAAGEPEPSREASEK